MTKPIKVKVESSTPYEVLELEENTKACREKLFSLALKNAI